MGKQNPNENCLEGMKCPECESFGPFKIEATKVGMVTVYDDGTEDDHEGDMKWKDSSPCECTDCGHEATVAEFNGEEAPSKSRFVVVLEGDTSLERAVHVLSTKEEAEEKRIEHAKLRAGRSSPVLEVPRGVAQTFLFNETVEKILRAAEFVDYVKEPDETVGGCKSCGSCQCQSA